MVLALQCWLYCSIYEQRCLGLRIKPCRSQIATSKYATLAVTYDPQTEETMNDATTHTDAVRAFWESFRGTHPAVAHDTPYDVWHFGDDQELADALYPLVLRGVKRAGASLLWEYERKPDTLPKPGGYSVITDFESCRSIRLTLNSPSRRARAIAAWHTGKQRTWTTLRSAAGRSARR
jgi:hypothetical protein